MQDSYGKFVCGICDSAHDMFVLPLLEMWNSCGVCDASIKRIHNLAAMTGCRISRVAFEAVDSKMRVAFENVTQLTCQSMHDVLNTMDTIVHGDITPRQSCTFGTMLKYTMTIQM